ncbi:MAG: apolipoprotein N-acyltransferase, partial [Actinobacteria bacterium]|nr:apolipoprotein N-acyltransferase [Actinomycetota bacterium]
FKRHLATTNKYLASKSYAINPADLIIWPENASDLDPITTPEIARDITALGREFTGDILIGAVLNGEDGPKNAAILYKDNGNIEQYIKRDLAPFGEYIPLRTIAERISPLAKEITDFIPGSNSAVFSTENGVFTPLICFELLDDAFATKTNLKSNFLVSITNNATFGKSSEAAQQFLIARVRAYESRKEAAIVSTTGYTGFIDSKGRVMVQAAQFDQSATSREISLNNYQTPISKNRNFPELLVTAIFLLTFYRRKRG